MADNKPALGILGCSTSQLFISFTFSTYCSYHYKEHTVACSWHTIGTQTLVKTLGSLAPVTIPALEQPFRV